MRGASNLRSAFGSVLFNWRCVVERRIIGVFEADARRGAVDFVEERETAPSDLKTIVEVSAGCV